MFFSHMQHAVMVGVTDRGVRDETPYEVSADWSGGISGVPEVDHMVSRETVADVGKGRAYHFSDLCQVCLLGW